MILRIINVVIWIAAAIMLARTAYAFVIGTDVFGTGVFGGTTTTSTYIPGGERNNIIGGGLVLMIPERNEEDKWNNDVKFSLVYKPYEEDF